MTVIKHESREAWLAWRHEKGNAYYGASDASTCAGINPYKEADELYMEKVGLKVVQDISEKERVLYGTLAEAPLRRLFELDFMGRISVVSEPFYVYLDSRYPFIGATLDGLLEYTGDEPFEVRSPTGYTGVIRRGDSGIYEGKTAQVRRAQDSELWAAMCPEHYFAQGCHQLYVMRSTAKFWIVNALVERLRYTRAADGEFVEIVPEQRIVRHVYFMDDPVVRDSIEFVISKVVEMHWRVENKMSPPTVLGW